MSERPFRRPESYKAEEVTRAMLPRFLQDRGFSVESNSRERQGQTIVATSPEGERVTMRVRLCWRRETNDRDSERVRKYSAAQLLANIKNDDWIGSLQAKVAREKSRGVTHLLFVQRDDKDIKYAALVPLPDLVHIWTNQRDISKRLIREGKLGRRKKNHAMNGTSPTLWLQDDRGGEEVADALWKHPGVRDLAKVEPTRPVRLPEEVPSGSAYSEGSVQRILVNRYERDPRAREPRRSEKMGRKTAKWALLWEDMQKVAAKGEWLQRVKADPEGAWHEVAANCAEDAYKNNFPSRRGTYVINDAPTASGQVMCLYNNNPYDKPPCHRRDKETELFRLRIKDAGIRELGYATYPPDGEQSAGYSYAMILDTSEDQIGTVHESLKLAMREAAEWFKETGSEQEDVAEESREVGDQTIAIPEAISVGETVSLRQTRVGQDAFSRAVRDNYCHRCCFPRCEIDCDALLVGAHVARWSDDPASRGDVSNGLCLCALHDKAFEAGLFTLTDEFVVKVDLRKSPSSAWARSQLQKSDGQPIKLGRIRPSLLAIRQHRERHA